MLIVMTEDRVMPIVKGEEVSAPLGRRADMLAALLAGCGTTISIIGASWFFLGFAENDTRPEHLTSALVLTVILFAFAIVPFLCVFQFARRAHRHGTKRAHLLWTVFLMLPWVGLGAIAVSHTPLPIWCGLIIAGLAALLTLWAIVSLVLDWNVTPENTLHSQQNEMPDATE